MDRIIEVCVLAGRIMLESGGETYRVEDTMSRIASTYQDQPSHSFVMPTGIIFSIDGDSPTKLVRIINRTTDLSKVAHVNAISRRITGGEFSVKEAYTALKEVQNEPLLYSNSLRVIAAAISCGCFLIMYQGRWSDFIPSVITGGIGFTSFIYFHKLLQIKFFSEFLASFIIGMLAFFLVFIHLGHQADKIIIGSVMSLVPGVLITNAVRDLMAGHLISGLSKGAEAFLTASAIGAGIAVCYALI